MVQVPGIGVEAVERSSRKLESAARAISRLQLSRREDAEPDHVEMSEAAIELLRAQREYEAALRLVSVSDDLSRKTLDLLA
jgi:flagellar hook protein FlgE